MADGEKRVIDLQALSTNDLTANHYFLVDDASNDGETKKYSASDYKANMQITVATLYNELDLNDVAWDSNTQYHNHDIVIYTDYMLYMCKVDDSTRGTWVSNEWQQITLLELWGDSMMTISTEPMLFDGTPYSKNDIVYRISPNSTAPYKMSFYKAKADLPNGISSYVATDWNEFSTITDLIEDCNRQIDKLEDDMSQALAEGTVSGSIATFTDGSTLPMKKLEVAIEPQQDLHGYENPWVGGSGKNKFEATGTNQYTTLSNGIYTLTSLPSSNTSFSLGTITLKAGNSYILSGGVGNSFRILVKVNNVNYISGSTESSVFSVSEDTTVTVSAILETSATLNSKLKPMIRLSSVSDATFEPYSNICPISGWDECNVSRTGKNIFGTQLESGTLKESSSVGSDYDSMKSPNTARVRTAIPFKIIQKPITISIKSGYSFFLLYLDGEQKYLGRFETWNSSNATFTDANVYYLGIIIKKNDGSNITVDDVDDVLQIELGNETTSYEDYGTTYTIDLDGTRYGGKLDVVSGVLTVDRAYVDMGDLNWFYTSDAKLFTASIQGIKSGVYTNTNLISSIYPVKPMSYSQFDYGMRYNSATAIGVKNPLYTDATSFKQAMSGVQLVYELATPITYQLTPTEVKSLLATNNVFADTGDIIDATYVRNANITINDLIRRIEALES